MSQTIITRNQVKKEDTWRLEHIFATDEVFKATLQAQEAKIKDLVTYEGKLLQNGQTLFDFLTMQDAFWVTTNQLYVYAHMRLHEDGNNSFYQDLSQKSEMLTISAQSQLAFVSPELSLVTVEKLAQFYEEVPKLRLYTHFFDELLRQKAHILDTQTEALLAQVSDVAGTAQNTFAMLNNVDLKFPTIENAEGSKVPITHATFVPLMESEHRQVRQSAFDTLYATYGQYKNTFASLFTGNVKQFGLFANARHFEGPLAMALSENDVPTKVYHNLIATVNKHLDLLHDYMALRKETLGLEDLHMYDLYVPMVKESEKTYDFETAKAIILEALKPLGEDYLETVKSAFDAGWIDKYENAGKRSGAYSWSAYGTPHPYILLNYTPNLNSVFTLIHEMGHAMHTHYSYKNQPAVYGDYCIFVAEVASTVNEALLMQYLLKQTTDPDERRFLLNYFMDQFKSTLYRQTMFAEFELMMHESYQKGETLTADFICQSYEALVKKYHGDAVTVDPAIALEWARIPHFYTPFYVYQYATGYSAAITLSTRILEEGEAAVKDYKAFLSGGCSQDPISLLKIAGVDMSESEPIEKALACFKDIIHQFKN